MEILLHWYSRLNLVTEFQFNFICSNQLNNYYNLIAYFYILEIGSINKSAVIRMKNHECIFDEVITHAIQEFWIRITNTRSERELRILRGDSRKLNFLDLHFRRTDVRKVSEISLLANLFYINSVSVPVRCYRILCRKSRRLSLYHCAPSRSRGTRSLPPASSCGGSWALRGKYRDPPPLLRDLDETFPDRKTEVEREIRKCVLKLHNKTVRIKIISTRDTLRLNDNI